MIEFHCTNYAADGTPIVRDRIIEAYTEAIIRKYKPELLKEPGRLDPENFIESYLGAEITFQDIFYTEVEGKIAGCTVFHNSRIPVFSREKMAVEHIPVNANTVIIDNDVKKLFGYEYERFTMFHEAGHLCLHKTVSQYQAGSAAARSTAKDFLMCRGSRIGRPDPKKEKWTEEDFREHQADVFAACIMMPRRTFCSEALGWMDDVNAARGFILESDRKLYAGQNDDEIRHVSQGLGDVFGVSRAAAELQLRRYGLIRTRQG